MFSNSFDPHSSNHNGVLARMYFDTESKNAEGKTKCRKCDAVCNSGHGSLVSRVKTRHASCWQEELKQHLQGATRGSSGCVDSLVSITKVLSDETKNTSSWIEWTVLADLPATAVESEHYRKNSTLGSDADGCFT